MVELDTLGLVGEGVETPAERNRLDAAGCDFLQSCHFARPGALPGQTREAATMPVSRG
jgi:EAL domain-containing protein (putative c-di-GMP-specific phosphodiesterase class I)